MCGQGRKVWFLPRICIEKLLDRFFILLMLFIVCIVQCSIPTNILVTRFSGVRHNRYE